MDWSELYKNEQWYLNLFTAGEGIDLQEALKMAMDVMLQTERNSTRAAIADV